MSATLTEPFVPACLETIERLAPYDRADWLVVCGSGIHEAFVGPQAQVADLKVEATVALADLGLPAPTVAGHGHALVFARLGERRVVLQTGRIHPYEGHDLQICLAALQALLLRGAGGLVLTCAVGGLNPGLRTGALVLLRDQLALFGNTPLVGSHFVDCSAIYTKALRDKVQAQALAQGQPLFEAVYGHARGPQYETPAEVEALRRLGADVVGMSTTYEAILAAAHRTPCLGIGVVTNAAGDHGLSHVDVQSRAGQARSHLAALVANVLQSDPTTAQNPNLATACTKTL